MKDLDTWIKLIIAGIGLAIVVTSFIFIVIS